MIGGGPAGLVSALTAKRYYPEKKVVVMRDIVNGCIPCGIPYMFWSLKDPDDNKLGLDPLKKSNIEVVIDRAVKINRDTKTVITESQNEYKYEKLILALGSLPIKPPIKGINKQGIYPIHKDMDYLKKVISEFREAKNVLILGGGFIGVEFADEISKKEGFNVYLAEILPHLLENSFDVEFSSDSFWVPLALRRKVLKKKASKLFLELPRAKISIPEACLGQVTFK